MAIHNGAPNFLNLSTASMISLFKAIQAEEKRRQLTDPKYMKPARHNPNDRYSDVYAYEFNKVRFAKSNTHINASHIRLLIPDILSYSRHYIATQGPLKSTYADFWHMCYEQSGPRRLDPVVIVMVTPLTEGRYEKCFKYWPGGVNTKSIDLKGSREFGTLLIVEHVATSVNDAYVHTHMRLTPYDSPEGYVAKEVHHFHYMLWSDSLTPMEYSHLLEISRKAWSHLLGPNYMSRQLYNETPMIVHCSAGVGRTGTFIALDYVLNYCKQFVDREWIKQNHTEQRDPIETTVRELRKQRMLMVQTSHQYTFLYDAAESAGFGQY